MKLCSNLSFDGRCAEAFRLYEDCLGGKVLFRMTYEDTPMDLDVPPGWGKKLSHATFALGDLTLYGSDAPPDRYRKPQGFALQLNLSDARQSERIFQLLSENGTIETPLSETFWALRFGVVTDQFGIPWVINCEKAV